MSQPEHEKWRTIKQHPRYEVSNFGRVRSKNFYQNSKAGSKSFHRSRVLKQHLTKCGYKKVVLGLGETNSRKNESVHRLVATAFLPNPNNLPVVNHKDGNKQNNVVSNLEWATVGENVNHAYNLHLTTRNKEVVCLDRLGNVIKNYRSTRETEKDGFTCSGVSEACNGLKRNHMYRGYIWRFKNDI